MRFFMTDSKCEMKRLGSMFIFAAPSGGGKSSVIKKVLGHLDDIQLSVSATTRQPRDGEVEGKDYYFISEEQFKKLIKDKQLYEYVDSDFGPKYGTPKAPVEELLKQGKDVILDLDYPGVQSLKAIAGDRVKAIALLPPSMRVLKERLVNRGTDADEVIERRMSMAEKRIRESQFYDYVIMNDDLDKAADEAISIIKATRVERKNICELEEFINQIVEDK